MDGDPARFQRYQDSARRAALLRLPLRVRASRTARGTSTRARTTSAGATRSIIGNYEPRRQAVAHRQLPADPAVLQRRHDDAVYGQRRHAACSTTRRSARSRTARRTSTPTSRSRRSSTCASGATSAASTWSRRRSRTSTSRPASRRRSTAASCPGAPASASATTSRWRCPTTRATNDFTIGTEWTNTKQHAARRLQRLVVRQPRADAGLGQPAPPRRRVRHAGTRTHVALAVELGADHQLRRLHQAGAQDAGDGLLLLRHCGATTSRCSPSRSTRRCRTIALPRANTEGEAHVFSTNLNLDVAAHRPTGGSARASATTPTTTRCRRRRITQYDQLRLERVDDAHRRSGSLRAQPDELRRATPRGAGLKPLALTVGYTHNGNGYDARIFESSGEDVFRVSADAVGTSWLTFRAQYEFGDRTGSGLDETQLIAIGEHPEMRHYDLADRTRNRFTAQVDIVPSDAWMFSVSGGVLQGRLQQQLLRAAGVDRPHLLARRRLPSAERPGRGRQLQLRAVHRAAAVARRRFVGGAVQRSAARLDGGLDRDGALLLDLRHAAPHRPQHRGAVLLRLQLCRGQQPLHDSRRAARFRRPISCRTCSTSCSSCTSTCGTGLSSRLAATFSYLYEPLSIYDFAFDPSVVNGIVAAELAGHGLRLSSLHRQLGGVRRPLSLVESRDRSCLPWRIHATTRSALVTTALGLAVALSSRSPAAAQDAAQSRRARRSTPRRSARSATPSPVRAARANPLDGVGAKLSADDIRRGSRPDEAAAKAKSTKKPPMPARYGKLPAADLDALVAYMQSLK